MTTPTIPKRFSGSRGGSDAPRPQNHGGLRDDLRAAQLGPVADSSSGVRDVVQRCGYGSIAINTIFNGMNIHKSQLFWCELQGSKVLTHCHASKVDLPRKDPERKVIKVTCMTGVMTLPSQHNLSSWTLVSMKPLHDIQISKIGSFKNPCLILAVILRDSSNRRVPHNPSINAEHLFFYNDLPNKHPYHYHDFTLSYR